MDLDINSPRADILNRIVAGLRLGDRIEQAVKPIAKAIGHPCLDESGKLKPNSPCAKRRDFLNGVKEDAQSTGQ